MRINQLSVQRAVIGARIKIEVVESDDSAATIIISTFDAGASVPHSYYPAEIVNKGSAITLEFADDKFIPIDAPHVGEAFDLRGTDEHGPV